MIRTKRYYLHFGYGATIQADNIALQGDLLDLYFKGNMIGTICLGVNKCTIDKVTINETRMEYSITVTQIL